MFSTFRRKSSSFLEESESGESDKDVKSKPVLQLSSDDEDLLDDFTKEVDMPEVLPKKTSSVSSWHDEMLHTPQTQSNAKIDPNDDRDMSDFKTPFKTPRRPVKLPNAWERPFETPTADYRRKQSTEPSEFKGECISTSCKGLFYLKNMFLSVREITVHKFEELKRINWPCPLWQRENSM